ncbi:MAG TPA: ComEC/Rec2 family competence protein [Streptosporangiaceae bacterium]|nr:ComEC/Rec2 family competence protein [Streptosporangiaceae bacterium]
MTIDARDAIGRMTHSVDAPTGGDGEVGPRGDRAGGHGIDDTFGVNGPAIDDADFRMGGDGRGRAGGGQEVADFRLVIPAAATWLTALVLIGCRPAVAYAVAGICGGACAAALMAARRRRRVGPVGPVGAVAGAALACAAASAAGVGLRLSAVGSGPVRALAVAGARATIDAVVIATPQPVLSKGREIILVRVRAERVRGRGGPTGTRVPVLVLAAAQRWRSVVISQRVRFTARLVPPDRAGLLAAVALVRGPPAVLEGPTAVQRAAETIRSKLRAACDPLPPEQRGVLPGMVVGDTSRLDRHLSEDFRAAGLSHLLVVSGANLAIVVGAVLWLTRIIGVGRRWAAVLAAAAVLGFVIVARPEPSVLRATVMAMIGLLALISGRRRHGVAALSAAVLLLVLADPELARSYGFALSVAATAALLVLAPRWRDRLCRWLPRIVAEPLAVAAAAQLACAPLLVMLSGEVGLVAVGANLLAGPAVVPATLLGAAAGVVAPVALPLARLLVWPAGLSVGWIVGVAHVAAALPYATVDWPDGLLGGGCLLAAVAVALWALRRGAARRIAAALLAGLLIVVLGARVWQPGWPPRGWLFVACDVGQGDGLVLAAGRGRAVVVDTGPDPRLMDRCLSDLGVKVVPLIVLTHPHADHIDGLPGVLRGRTVGHLLTSGRSAGEELRGLRGVRAAQAWPGQRWTVGELSLTVLAPGPQGPRVSTRDDGATVNNISVVLAARWPGLGVLLSGDLETEAQRSLTGGLAPVDVLKVPHHGSRLQDPAFLAASGARTAVISVGADNDYGHPAPATLARLRDLGMRVFRTDTDGSIAVARTADGLTVVPRVSRSSAGQ